MSGVEAAELANLILVGVLAGNDLGHWSVVHPALGKVPAHESFTAEKAIFGRYRYFMPILVPLAIASGIVVAVIGDKSDTSFWLAVAGVSLLGVWQFVVLTLYPLNERILGAESREPTADEWWALRRSWYARHTVRVWAGFAAFVLFVLSALLA